MRPFIRSILLALLALAPVAVAPAVAETPIALPASEEPPPVSASEFATVAPPAAMPAVAVPIVPVPVAPPPSRVTIAVLGDSLGDGMWGGLYRLMIRDKRYGFVRAARNSVGFAADDLLDMIDGALAQGPVDAAVIMIGANDRRSFFVGTQSKALFRSKAWLDMYSARVGAFMDRLEQRKLPTVWILLPVMRDAEASKDAQLINDIVVKAAATRPGVKTLPTWPMTVDETGAYTAHFKDIKGVKRLMRADDGVHFQPPAYELIGDAVLRSLRESVTPFKLLGAG